MTIYVVETIYDYLVQVGFSLSKEKAQKEADKLNNKKASWHEKYFVTEYNVTNKNSFCRFNGG